MGIKYSHKLRRSWTKRNIVRLYSFMDIRDRKRIISYLRNHDAQKGLFTDYFWFKICSNKKCNTPFATERRWMYTSEEYKLIYTLCPICASPYKFEDLYTEHTTLQDNDRWRTSFKPKLVLADQRYEEVLAALQRGFQQVKFEIRIAEIGG